MSKRELTEEQKEKQREYNKKYYKKNKEKIAEQRREYREKNKEKIAEQRREYREKNKEKIAAQRRKYREKNKEKLAEQQREYNKKNKEKVAEYKKQYYEKNKEKVAEHQRKYREKNKEKLAEYHREYKKKHKEKIAEHQKRYYEKNKEKIAEYQRKYREKNKKKVAAMKSVYVIVMDSQYIGTNRDSDVIVITENSPTYVHTDMVKVCASREKAESYLLDSLSDEEFLKCLIADLKLWKIADIEIEREEAKFDGDISSDKPLLLCKSVWLNKKRKLTTLAPVDEDESDVLCPHHIAEIDSDVYDRYLVEFFIEWWEVE